MKARRIRGVYYYQRFVDDIIIFTTASPNETFSELSSCLSAVSSQFRLGVQKTSLIDEVQAGPDFKLAYLGYDYSRKPGKPNTLEVRIAQKKIDRLKSRILLSFRQFRYDFRLLDLRDRVKLLTGNYSVNKTNTSEDIYTGIYYNYPLITNKSQLVELDFFLRIQIVAARARLNREVEAFSAHGLMQLMKFSFLSGHDKRITHKYKKRRLQYLTQLWKHA